MKLWMVSFFSLLVMIMFGHAPPVLAQTPQETYTRLLALYDIYRTDYALHINTKNQYLQYGTLSSRTEALAAVKKLMNSRSEVLLEYLQLLRLSNKEPLYVPTLEDHTSYIQNEKDKIPALATLEDVERYSSRIENRHVNMHVLSRQIVGTILADRVDHIRLRLLVLENDAALMIATLRSQNKDVATLERWLADERNKRLLGEEQINLARNQILEIDANSVDSVNREFTNVQQTLNQGKQYFVEAISFMGELSNAIKYGNY